MGECESCAQDHFGEKLFRFVKVCLRNAGSHGDVEEEEAISVVALCIFADEQGERSGCRHYYVCAAVLPAGHSSSYIHNAVAWRGNLRGSFLRACQSTRCDALDEED